MELHIPVAIFESSLEDSLMFASTSVFPRDELPCIIGLCRGHFPYFKALMYQGTSYVWVPAAQSDKLCLLSMLSRLVMFSMSK